MSRDAIPHHEIEGIVKRLSGGESLGEIQSSLPSVAKSWFERNKKALHEAAGVELPPVEQPEKTEPEQPAEEPELEAEEPDEQPRGRGKRGRG